MPRRREPGRKKAVALDYEPAAGTAPKVAAKGQGPIAEKIIEIAREHGIPIREDPDLVEALSALDLDQEIPPDLYQVVAEVLAWVYSINKGYSPREG